MAIDHCKDYVNFEIPFLKDQFWLRLEALNHELNPVPHDDVLIRVLATGWTEIFIV